MMLPNIALAKMVMWLALCSLLPPAALGQHYIAMSWQADTQAVRAARYNRQLQNPGGACSPSPCGDYTTCQVNNQGNAICSCIPGYIPLPSPVDGCCPPDKNPSSNLILQNRLGGGPGHLSVGYPRAPQDPCSPSPCGPGTECSVNPDGNPVCRCQAGYSPNPDTITGCKPECTVDPDCRMGFICRSYRCQKKPDPCDPNPCGPGARCTKNNVGNAICQCQAGLIPKPDTITGCGPECVRDPDCQHGYICQSQRCIVKPDPCDPSPCGPGTTCTVNLAGNPICRCNPGLIPKPDTITGCGPECDRDPDCQNGYICQNQRCIVKPDPCDPSPCGPNTMCMANSLGNPICRCLKGYIPMPDTISGCKRECEVDYECSTGYICQDYRCVERPDPCDPSPCGPNTECNTNRQGNPVCTCLPGFDPQPDTITGCQPKPRTAPPPRDPCQPSPCGRNTRCEDRNGNAVCLCLPGYIPLGNTIEGCEREPEPCNPNPCGPGAECRPNGRSFTCSCPSGYKGDPYTRCQKGECEYDDECSSRLACFDFYCRDPCADACGQGAECEVRNHRPICSCPQGYTGDPLSYCKKRIVVGGTRTVTNPPQSRGTIVIGQEYNAQRPQEFIGGRTAVVGSNYNSGAGGCASSGCGRSGSSSSRGGVVVIGAGGKRRRRRRNLSSSAELDKFMDMLQYLPRS